MLYLLDLGIKFLTLPENKNKIYKAVPKNGNHNKQKNLAVYWMGSIASNTEKNYFAQFKTFIMPNSFKKIHPKTVRVIIKKQKQKQKLSTWFWGSIGVFIFRLLWILEFK